jgi:hypothetical protein
MTRTASLAILAPIALSALASCNEFRQAPPKAEEDQKTIVVPAGESIDLGEMPPPDRFVAIEPTEVGVVGAPTIWEALAPIGKGVPEGEEGDQTINVAVRKDGEIYVADVVRTGLLDDSVAADHVRIQFRREPEGWFPTNAYRRQECRRGRYAGKWGTEACP